MVLFVPFDQFPVDQFAAGQFPGSMMQPCLPSGDHPTESRAIRRFPPEILPEFPVVFRVSDLWTHQESFPWRGIPNAIDSGSFPEVRRDRKGAEIFWLISRFLPHQVSGLRLSPEIRAAMILTEETAWGRSFGDL